MKDLSAKLRLPETSADKPEKFVIFTGNRWFVGVFHAAINSGLNAFLDPSWPQAREAISPRLESVHTGTILMKWANPNASLGLAGPAPEQG